MDQHSHNVNTLKNGGAKESACSVVEGEQTEKLDNDASQNSEISTQTPKPPKQMDDKDQSEYPGGFKLALIVASLFLAVFLVALDRTIIGNAIPKITDDFHSIDDVGWYGSAFLITGCAMMLLFGRIYTFYSIKWVFLSTIGIFEIGSTICGAAPNSTTFIIGRAIAGLGSAGIFSGAIIILVHTVPLAKRPIYQGMFGALFGISSVGGPLLGGALTENVSWRWCFYINLPIGGATIAAITLMLHLPHPTKTSSLSLRQQILKLDPFGTILFLPGSICLILALQWGGTQYSWHDARIITLLVLASVLLTAFIFLQIFQREENATVPPRLLKQRSVAAALLYSICTGASMLVVSYYLPLWFQAIKGVSAVESGIRLLPMILSLVVGAMTGAGITFKSGYYTPSLIVSTCITSVGAGLISTWHVDTPSAKWIGYQVVYGFGLGIGMQQSNTAVQTVLTKKDVPAASSLIFFAQTLGGAVFLAVAQNVFSNDLRDGLMSVHDLPAGTQQQSQLVATILNTGATEVRDVVPKRLLGHVLYVFNEALMKAVYVAMAMSCTSIIGALAMEWKSIKKGEGQGEKKKKEEIVEGKLGEAGVGDRKEV